MIEIDGSRKSGSGTIVRDAVVFSILTRQDILLKNIRVKRPKPGLRHQHLKAIEASARISESSVEGASLGSKEIVFKPGPGPKGGSFKWDIGTAGSTSMLALTVIPISLFAGEPSTHKITGGLFQDFAPSLFHMEHVLLPTLRRMGADLRVKILQPGYVPRGGGCIMLEIAPLKSTLKPCSLGKQGKVMGVKGVALSSLLSDRRVSERMAGTCRETLVQRGLDPRMEIIQDKPDRPAFEKTSLQPGAALAIWATTDNGCILGADMAGARGRTAEAIGKRTAINLMEDLDSGATVDRHLADQLVPFAALAEGTSTQVIPSMTDHVESRLWLVQEMLGAGVQVDGNRVSIEGVGMKRVGLDRSPGKPSP